MWTQPRPVKLILILIKRHLHRTTPIHFNCMWWSKVHVCSCEAWGSDTTHTHIYTHAVLHASTAHTCSFNHQIPKHIDCYRMSPSPDVQDELFSVLHSRCWRARPESFWGSESGGGPLTAFNTLPSPSPLHFSSPKRIPQVSLLLLYCALCVQTSSLPLKPCPSSLPPPPLSPSLTPDSPCLPANSAWLMLFTELSVCKGQTQRREGGSDRGGKGWDGSPGGDVTAEVQDEGWRKIILMYHRID